MTGSERPEPTVPGPRDPGDASGPAVPGAADDSALLPCGRDAALVWDRAADGVAPDEHERGCPHCGAARADARGLDGLVHRLAGEPVAPPPSVLERVMDDVRAAVRTDLRPHELIALPSPHGPARMSRVAAAAVLRRTVDEMGGLRARSCRIEQVVDTSAGVAQAGPGSVHAVDVRITVAARFGVDLAAVTARVRQMVAAAGEQTLGVPVRRVDIDVVDVVENVPAETP